MHISPSINNARGNRVYPGWVHLFCALCAFIILGGCAVGPNPADPWEKSNRAIYNFNEGFDRALLKPAADFYVKVVPAPVRIGVGNGFDNLGYFNVILNDFLQAKWDQGLGDTGRMVVNSTLGVAGIFDVATPLGYPYHYNNFGITLGKWGVKQGPYIVIPFYGPSTVRDAPGLGMQVVTNPVFWLDPPWSVTIPLGTVGVLDKRSREDADARLRAHAAIDPYVFTRDAYLQFRESKIHEGQSAQQNSGFYDEDMDSTTGPTSRPSTPGGQPKP